MEQVKEFKLGDFISKDEVYTPEGSAKYRRMSDFCNDNKLVMKETSIEVKADYPEGTVGPDWILLIQVYMISEPDAVEEKPTPEEEARAERDECRQWFRKVGGHDDMAIKCAVLGMNFRTAYPELFEEGVRRRARINELEKAYPGIVDMV